MVSLPRFLRRRNATERMRERLLRMMPQGSACAEIGVYKGDFSKRILKVVKPRVLHLVDPWRHEAGDAYKEAWYGGKAEGQTIMDDIHHGVKVLFRKQIATGRVVIHRADSTHAAQEIADGSLDWVYIDGNHLYDYVKADLESWTPKVRAGGYVTGDDYIEGGWWEGGVKKAVDEFLERPDIEPVLIQDTQFILQRR